MIEVLPSPDHVIALHARGTISGEDFDRAAQAIEAKLARHARIGVFVDMTGFHDMTVEAAAKDLRYAFGKFGDWKRFPREAIVSDRHWVRSLVGLAGATYLAGIEARVFPSAERDAALAWAAEVVPA